MWSKPILLLVSMAWVGVLLAPITGAADEAPEDHETAVEDREAPNAEESGQPSGDDSDAGPTEAHGGAVDVERAPETIRGRQMLAGLLPALAGGVPGLALYKYQAEESSSVTSTQIGLGAYLFTIPPLSTAAMVSLLGSQAGFSYRFGRTLTGAAVASTGMTALYMMVGPTSWLDFSGVLHEALVLLAYPGVVALGAVLGYHTGDEETGPEARRDLKLTPMTVVDEERDEYGAGLGLRGRF